MRSCRVVSSGAVLSLAGDDGSHFVLWRDDRLVDHRRVGDVINDGPSLLELIAA
jgi:hypothetical protein